MFLFNNIIFNIALILCIDTYISAEIHTGFLRARNLISNDGLIKKLPKNADTDVNIKLYYECLCPDCRKFDTTQFKQVVQVLSNYLTIQTFPYGNAKTFKDHGKYKFRCQHGPRECYGNKLHACAIDNVQNQTQALLYNACMMDESRKDLGSDDNAADECGSLMNIDSETIKECAKGERGIELLKYYGDESKKANFHYVPYVLLNKKEYSGDNFLKDVCAAFANPPPPCASIV